MDFKGKYDKWLEVINLAIDKYVTEKNVPEKTVYSSMRYSLTAGGKRLRPILALAVCDLFKGDENEVIPYACAIEMIHTYSLIHDDLPAMDNDDYRRGRLTNHKVFGDAIAVLAGDALLNYAFEVMLNDSIKSEAGLLAKTRAMCLIAKASGTSGMIGGQVVDLESEGKEISKEMLKYMHQCKTGAMIKAPIMASAVLCGANEEELSHLEMYAEKIGLAFQIKDDILDIEGNLATMGKKSGSDIANQKSTFVTLYGIDKSKTMLNNITNEAIENIGYFGERSEFLKELALYVINRKN
jgi:geranylgeranyl diphosphate synthase, type II